jgi:hypothetical protein
MTHFDIKFEQIQGFFADGILTNFVARRDQRRDESKTIIFSKQFERFLFLFQNFQDFSRLLKDFSRLFKAFQEFFKTFKDEFCRSAAR